MHNQLSGSVPGGLRSSKELERLDVEKNKLAGSLPSALLALRDLRMMDVNYNMLTGSVIAPKSSRLERLRADHNRLEGCIPQAFSRMDLKLTMHVNRLSGSIPESFPTCKHLQVSYNQLSGLCMPSWCPPFFSTCLPRHRLRPWIFLMLFKSKKCSQPCIALLIPRRHSALET